MDHNKLIASLTNALSVEQEFRCLCLSGSHASGLADQYSDIDFFAIVQPEAKTGIAARWRQAVAQTGEIVLWRDQVTRFGLINTILADWTRIDLVVLTSDNLRSRSWEKLKPLFDHDDLFKQIPQNSQAAQTDPAKLKYQIEEFIRILGLLHLAVGREEYITGLTGVFHLRNLLIDLLVEETAVPHRGGALHLNRLLSREQHTLLQNLPVTTSDRDSLIATHLAYAEAYLPRARILAQRYILRVVKDPNFSGLTFLMRTIHVGV